MKHKMMYCCDICEKPHDQDELRVMSDGQWVCYECLDLANVVFNGHFDDLPMPNDYGVVE